MFPNKKLIILNEYEYEYWINKLLYWKLYNIWKWI